MSQRESQLVALLRASGKVTGIAVRTSRAVIAALPRRSIQARDSLDDLVLYLCSDRSQAMTGATFTIDDGQSL